MLNSALKSDCPIKKNVLEKKYPFVIEKTTKKIYAMGVVKYPKNSFLYIVKIFFIVA